jgi:choline-sulfatase
MTHRFSIVFLIVILSLVLSPCSTHAADDAAKATRRPNVLFFAVDDLRPEFGAYGKNYVHSPNLDRLAARGVTFTRAYCQQAVCSPSRSSLLTGTRPDTTKVWDLETHFRKALPDVVTLPQHFKQNGYFVQGMGKLFHGGFDDPQSWSVPWTGPKAPHGAYGSPENLAIREARLAEAKSKPRKTGAGKVRAYGPAFESSEVPDNTFHDGKVAEMAVAALRECAKKDQPFWLGVGFIRPHLPFVAPKKYWDLYDPAKIELAANPFPPKDAPPYTVVTGGELRTYYGIPSGPIPDDLARQLKHGYYAAISYMDAQMGHVLDELDQLGLKDNTIVVLWGDHGWKLGEHGGWCKHSNVENDTNAPLLISVPGLKTAGQKTESLAEFVDIYPTLAELCGLPLPDHLAGRSLVPMLRDPKAVVKSAALSQYPRAYEGQQLMGYTMRTDRYRLTRWLQRDDHSQVKAVELYDEQNDPQENVNLANDPKHAELVSKLTEKWERAWQADRPAATSQTSRGG